MTERLPDSLHDAIASFAERAAIHLRQDVEVGPIAEVGAFDHERHRAGIALDSIVLSRLDTLEPVRLDWSGGDEATLTLTTAAASLRGKYRVASSRVSRPALQMAAALGADSSDALAAAAARSDTDLAAWFRDEELQRSENGRVLTGMYYAHEDTINDLTTGTWKASTGLRNELKSRRTKSTTDAVRASTAAHREARLRGDSPDNVPPIGSGDQESGGFAVQTNLLMAAKEAAGPSRDDPKNEYAQLINSMNWFGCAVRYVRKQQAGTLTPQEILRLVANTPQDQIPCPPPRSALAKADEGNEGPMWPVDRDYFLRVNDARAERRLVRALPPAGGAFSDDSVRIEIDLGLTNFGERIDVGPVRPHVSLLRIRLEPGEAFAGRETLHARMSAFVAETAFYIDLIRTRIIAALTTPAMIDRFTRSLNR
jgi:hypothetical protein